MIDRIVVDRSTLSSALFNVQLSLTHRKEIDMHWEGKKGMEGELKGNAAEEKRIRSRRICELIFIAFVTKLKIVMFTIINLSHSSYQQPRVQRDGTPRDRYVVRNIVERWRQRWRARLASYEEEEQGYPT